MSRPTRRGVLRMGAAALAAGAWPRPSLAAGPARIVIVGGGFGGASVARYLRRHDPQLAITLVEKDASFVTCPFSNGVLAELWPLSSLTFTYDNVRRAGIDVVQEVATAIDPKARSVRLAGGRTLAYDRLVLSPGIQLVWNAIKGYDQAAAERMPHAWLAGPQTTLLRRQLDEMPDGGLVVMAAPANPFRCPPGPYERASLIAHHLKTRKPRSKLIILDAKDSFSKQPLFEETWKTLYPGLVEWVPGSQAGKVLSVDPKTMTVSTGFDDFKPAVANIIPPQKAGAIAVDAGLDQGLGFCPVSGLTFESKAHRDIYVIGDAAIAGAMPKSGFSANNQAKACGAAILASLEGREVERGRLLNVCYSIAGPDYAFSIADVFELNGESIDLKFDAERTSPLAAPLDVRRTEAEYARSWYRTITSEMFG